MVFCRFGGVVSCVICVFVGWKFCLVLFMCRVCVCVVFDDRCLLALFLCDVV